MTDRSSFDPPRRAGTIFHLLAITICILGGVWGVWRTANAEVAPQLLLYLAPILILITLFPFLIYNLYALYRSRYILDRNGLILQWGWRTETIPMNRIQWIHQASNLKPAISPPLLRWPGAILGKRKRPGHPDIEFLASTMKNPVVISTPDQVYVISPARVEEFLDAYRHLTELGSLNPLPSQAARPTFMITQLWKQRTILFLTLTGAILVFSLLIWTVIVIPQRQEISLGFTAQGVPHQPLPSVRLILLPILYTLSYIGNLVIGLFLYRREKNRSLAYLLWGSSICIGLVFHISMLYIVT